MIISYHDYGWGLQWPIKKIEREITDAYLAPLMLSDSRVVLVNSTWYGREQHDLTMSWLRQNHWDTMLVISMIDAPIPDASWFAAFQRPVHVIGSFAGPHHISLWAEVVSRYIAPFDQHDIDLPFMCLNRKPHWHRVRLYEELDSVGVLDRGLVSLGGNDASNTRRTIPECVTSNDLAPNGTSDQHGIVNDIVSLGDLSNWRRHFLNVVTETVFDVDHKYFVSEKIFKPILGSRPFLVYALGGAERWLCDQGFCPYLDDFKDICDLDLREAGNIAPFLASLCDQGPAYWRHKYLVLSPKIQYNLDRFNRFISQQRRHIQQGMICQT